MGLHYFFAKNDPAKLLDLYNKSADTTQMGRIVDRLGELSAESELFALCTRTKSLSIISVLLGLIKDNPVKVLELYNLADNQSIKDSIVNKLCLQRDLNVLWHMQENFDIPEIACVIFDSYINQANQLEKLYYITDNTGIKKKVIDRLAELKENALLWKLDDPIGVYLRLSESDSFLEFYNRWTAHSSFFSDIEITFFFYGHCSEKQRLFFLLRNFVKQTSPLEFDLPVESEIPIPDYLHHHVNDAYELNINEVSGQFDNIWNKFLRTNKPDYIKLASLLNRKKLKQLLDSYDLCDDIQAREVQLRQSYLLKKQQATTKDEIERLLKAEQNDLKRIMHAGILKYYYGYKGPIDLDFHDYIPKIKFAGDAIELSTIDEHTFITDDVSGYINQIQEELDSALLSMSEANGILKAKSLARSKISNVLDKGDVAFSMANFDPDTIDAQRFDFLFRKIYSLNDPQLDLALLYCIKNTDDESRLKLILDNPRLMNYKDVLFSCLEGKYSSNHLLLCYNCLSKKPITQVEGVSPVAYVKNLITNSPDSKWLAINGDIYSSVDWKRVPTVSCQGNKAFSPDAKWLVTDYGVYSTGDWKKVADISGELEEFSPDSKWMVTSKKYPSAIEVYSTKDWIRAAYTSSPRAFSPDSKWLITEYNDDVYGYRISIHSGREWKCVANVSGEFRAFSPDSKWLVTDDGVYSTGSWREVDGISGKSGAFSPDAKWLVTNYGVYSTGDWRNVAGISGKNGAFSPDSKWLITGDGVYSTGNWEKVAQISYGIFSPDSKWLVTDDGVYSTGDWGKVADISGEFRAFSPDSKWLVTSKRVYSTCDWGKVAGIFGEFEAFSPNSQWLVTDRGVYYLGWNSQYLKEMFNSIIYLQFNGRANDVGLIYQLSRKMNGGLYGDMIVPSINHLIDILGKDSDAINLDKNNRPDSADVYIKR